jgi:hypothetical protein
VPNVEDTHLVIDDFVIDLVWVPVSSRTPGSSVAGAIYGKLRSHPICRSMADATD